MAAKRRVELGLGAQSRPRLERERADAVHSAFDLEAISRRGREVLDAREVA
jgi:hypothetical protein